ncbi:MAG: hypothetical protein HFH08_00085 [Bacilli bacterium]|nr:hypothetical protein [Bacilli bacterium]
MYQEYYSIPANNYQTRNTSMSNMPTSNTVYSNGDDRLIAGGFAFPFLLGGVTGAALAPAFWRPAYQPYPPRPYPPYYPPRPPYPYYRPF